MIRFSSTVAPLTPAAVERGASGAVMVGMGDWGFSRVLVAMVMQERCGEHAGGSGGAHPIGSTRGPM